MLGQAHHFRIYAPDRIDYAVNRYTNEAKRLYGVMDKRLARSKYIAGADYSIADIAIFPWLRSWKNQGIAWADYQLDKEFREVPASSAIAELFGVEPGTMLLERRFLFRAMGVPQQTSTSCYLLDMVAGTPIADPANEPWPGGNIAQLHTIGVQVTAVEETVRARMPMRDETEQLNIAGGVPVLTITRRMLAGDRVVEVAQDIVLPADRTELQYRIDLLEGERDG